MYQWVADRGGSISAEHGLGQMKNHMLGYANDLTRDSDAGSPRCMCHSTCLQISMHVDPTQFGC